MQTVRYVTRFAAGLLVFAGLLFWAGCDSSGNMSGGEGQFVLNLTDAPADLDSAVVTVDRVDLVSEDAEDDDGDDDNSEADEDDGIVTLTEETHQIDLLRLQDGVDSTLADVTVPGGEYSQLRFVLGDEAYVVENGEKKSLKVPSGATTGIKIVLPEIEVENDSRVEVTLDFDVEESFIQRDDGSYLFKPTVKVKDVSVDGESIETVEVDGTVSAVDETAKTVAVDDISFAVTDRTEFDGDNGAASLSDLQTGHIVEVEGTILADGTLKAREIDVEDDSDPERSITAPVESIGESTLTLLGVTIQTTNDTEFDDGGLADIQQGDRIEVGYEIRDGERVALEVEREDD